MSSSAHVLTLVAASDAPLIDDATIGMVREACNGAGEPHWLSPHRACDLPVADAEDLQVEPLRAALDRHRIDVNLIATANRRKRLLVADMDSTMVEQETLDELAGLVGKRDAVAAITARSMAGELDFAAALRERIAMLAGTGRGLIDRLIADITYVPGGATLIATMRANGAFAALVSGGFVEIIAVAAETLGFDAHRGNCFTYDGDIIAGLGEPIFDPQSKLASLKEFAAAQGLAMSDALTVGDGANDIPMLQAAGLGVAYRGKPKVRAAVPAQVNHADLTALLYLQGYSDREISAAASA